MVAGARRADDIRPYEKVSYICVILSEPEANRRIYALSLLLSRILVRRSFDALRLLRMTQIWEIVRDGSLKLAQDDISEEKLSIVKFFYWVYTDCEESGIMVEWKVWALGG